MRIVLFILFAFSTCSKHTTSTEGVVCDKIHVQKGMFFDTRTGTWNEEKHNLFIDGFSVPVSREIFYVVQKGDNIVIKNGIVKIISHNNKCKND